MTVTAATSSHDIIARHDAYLAPNYGRFPVAMVEGHGRTLRDADGKEYLDLFAGFGAPVLGHCHPDLVAAVTEQANTLWHVGNLMHTEPQTHAAEAIARMGFGGQSFFCHSGADANEAAFKLARLYGKAHPGSSENSGGAFGRYKIVSCTKSFHGRSFATMNATGNPAVRDGFGPYLPGYTNVAYNDIDAVENAIDDETVAVIAEPIQGEGGVHVPDPDYFRQLRAACDEHDLLLICDEVWTGCARTGKAFAYQHWFDEGEPGPDVMTLGKGVGGGLAVGVMCARPELAELNNARTQGGVKHATTLGGNCLSMAVTARLFEVIERDGLIERAARLGDVAAQRLSAFAASRADTVEVRGRGLFLGLQLDPSADGAWFNGAADVVRRCMERGLLVNATQGEVLRLAPAITITEDELDRGLSLLEEVIAG
ncbi:MAG: aminotransferase class III-fold pyridoxal phosphate-dependent enzyme [Planctomycetota bacterium]